MEKSSLKTTELDEFKQFFYSFLVQKGILFNYLHNIVSNREYRTFDRIVTHVGVKAHIISASFVFSNTLDGDLFWYEVDKEFMQYFVDNWKK